MKQTKRFLCWGAVAAWMVVIFLFSAQVGERSGDTSGQIVRWVIGVFYKGFADLPEMKQVEFLEVVHLLIRKGAHFTEYAVLAMLVANALRIECLKKWQMWILPIAVSALYALTDEIHQYFVPGRACRFLDVCIDTAGAAVGTALVMLFLLAQKQQKKKR